MTATITLYCDHHDDTRRGCLAVYTAPSSAPDEVRFEARRHGWRYDWAETLRKWVDLCPRHAEEAA